ncbi:matrix protein 2, partial [Influenza A virus (A/kelp gull/Argentina/LDC4/2006(H13N9))]
MSLLTEVETY